MRERRELRRGQHGVHAWRGRVVSGNENGSTATSAAPARGESGVSAGCASDENCDAGSAASTRGESGVSARRASNKRRREQRGVHAR